MSIASSIGTCSWVSGGSLDLPRLVRVPGVPNLRCGRKERRVEVPVERQVARLAIQFVPHTAIWHRWNRCINSVRWEEKVQSKCYCDDGENRWAGCASVGVNLSRCDAMVVWQLMLSELSFFPAVQLSLRRGALL